MATNSLILNMRKNEAETALHKLVTGQMPRVLVDQNGERIEYTMTNIAQLRAYIADLEAQINGGGLPGVRRPLQFIF